MRTKKHKSGLQKRQWVWYLFLLPSLFGIVFCMAYPIVEALRLSFFKSNGTLEVWKGVDNYKYVFSNSVFRKAIFNTFFITFFQLLFVIPVGFVIALAINSLKRCKNLLKILFFIPYVTPAIAAGTLFLFVLHPQGILNQLTGFFGAPAISWLENGISARFGAVILSVWKSLGFNIIIYLAYLQAISPEYYEAAAIDGCSSMQMHRYITIPHMRGAFAFLITMGWIQGLQRFTEVYALGGPTGSPARALHTIVGFIYERGFGNYEFGVAAAASYILFAIIMIFTLLNLKITKMDQ
jgi:multiple sugar transport system permease protein